MSIATPLPAAPALESPPARPWYRPGVADAVFLFVALLVVRGSAQGLLDDPGLGWHIRNIDAMIDKGGWLTEDPFTDPRIHERLPWYTNQWLGELPLWLGWRLAGLEGIAVATALVVGLVARTLYVILVRDGLTWPLALVWTALGTVGTSCSWNARPNVFTILFVLIAADICVRFASGRISRAKTWWLVPLFALWANMHGGFVAGLIILVASTLCELVRVVGGFKDPLPPSPPPRSGERVGPPSRGGPDAGAGNRAGPTSAPLGSRGLPRSGERGETGFTPDWLLPHLAAQERGEKSGDEEAKARLLHFAWLTGACLLATLVNPYGPWLYPWVFKLLGQDFFMKLHQEWKSPDFNSGGAIRFEILMLLFPLVLGLATRRPGLLELGLSVLWLHLALTGFRYVALWVVVATPVMARLSMSIPYLHELARRWQLTAGPGSLFATRPQTGPWAWSAVFGILLVGLAVAMQGRIAEHGDKIIATKALDRFLRLHDQWQKQHGGRRPVIFHSYDWGGYLTWHGWPKVLNWIDDRNEAQGKEHIEDYFLIRDTEPGWQKKLEKVDLVCIEPGAPLRYRLAEMKDRWREVKEHPDHHKEKDQEQAVIFERIEDR